MSNDWDRAEDDEDEDEIRPGDADYDLSEAHGYTWDDRPREDHSPVPRWLWIAVTALVVLALVLPSLLLVWRYG